MLNYPDGARRTPLPDLFFSRDLPELADPVALKTLLHLAWRVHRRARGRPAALPESEILGDPVLRRGVVALGYGSEAVDAALGAALRALVARGLLISRDMAGEGGQGAGRWLAIADRDGRQALQAIGSREGGGESAPPLGDAELRPNIFGLYETNIGILTPMIAEELREAEALYASEWVEDAMRLAVENGVRKWSYVRAILDRWRREGRQGEPWGKERDLEDHRRASGRKRPAREGHSLVPFTER